MQKTQIDISCFRQHKQLNTLLMATAALVSSSLEEKFLINRQATRSIQLEFGPIIQVNSKSIENNAKLEV